jgi:hypothetical protein
MQALGGMKGSRTPDLLLIDPSARPHPATPAYAHRDELDATGAFELIVDGHRCITQLVQWLLIFAVVGALIGGAKWWGAHHEEAAARGADPAVVAVEIGAGDGR